MTKDTYALFGSLTFLLICLALSLWNWFSQPRHAPQPVRVLFVVAEPEPPELAQFSDDFAEWFMLAMQENEMMSFKEAIILYLEEECFGRSNSGSLEENQ